MGLVALTSVFWVSGFEQKERKKGSMGHVFVTSRCRAPSAVCREGTCEGRKRGAGRTWGWAEMQSDGYRRSEWGRGRGPSIVPPFFFSSVPAGRKVSVASLVMRGTILEY